MPNMGGNFEAGAYEHLLPKYQVNHHVPYMEGKRKLYSIYQLSNRPQSHSTRTSIEVVQLAVWNGITCF